MSYIEKVSVGGTQYDLVDKNVASIEATNIASKAYAAGEYLVVGGQLCKAIAAIAQNDSLVLNTNIESTLVGDELQSLSNEIVPVSDAWDVGVSYAVDDICIYNNTLYKCILAHTSSLSILPTDTTYWTATSVGGELSLLNSNVTTLKNATTPIVVNFSGFSNVASGLRAVALHLFNLLNSVDIHRLRRCYVDFTDGTRQFFIARLSSTEISFSLVSTASTGVMIGSITIDSAGNYINDHLLTCTGSGNNVGTLATMNLTTCELVY